jgi:hypothetical protein
MIIEDLTQITTQNKNLKKQAHYLMSCKYNLDQEALLKKQQINYLQTQDDIKILKIEIQNIRATSSEQ